MPDVLDSIKRAALEAVYASKPVNVRFGTVTGIAPLTIQVDQKTILTAAHLVLSRNVTDYTVNITVDHVTENHTHTHRISDTYTGGGSASSETHNHRYTGTKSILIHNGLKVGDKVILIREQGGEKYVVMDRVGV